MKIKDLDNKTRLTGLVTDYGKIVRCTLNSFSDIVAVNVERNGVIYHIVTRYMMFLEWEIGEQDAKQTEVLGKKD